MVSVKSKLTGQTLFTLELDDGTLSLTPVEIRKLLTVVGESPIGPHLMVTIRRDSRPTPLSCMLGEKAAEHEMVMRDDAAHSDRSARSRGDIPSNFGELL